MGESTPGVTPLSARSPHLDLVTEESVYGTILVSGMIVASGSHDASSWETFLTVVGTVFVFWSAHVYAGTVAGHTGGDGDEPLRSAFQHSLQRSLGFVISAALPSLVLLLGALRVVPDALANWIALWLGVVILGFLGYSALASRGRSWPIRILGSLGTAGFGIAMILLKALIH